MLIFLFSAEISFQVGSSPSPATMTGGTCHEKGVLPPGRKNIPFRALSLSDFVKQAAFAALCAVALLGFDESCFAQIVKRPADGGLRQLQLSGDGRDGRPAFSVPVGSVRKVDIHGHRTVRQLGAV